MKIILFVISIILVFISIYFIHKYSKHISNEYFGENILSMKTYIINLDKNTERWNLIKDNYYKTDLATVPMERFSAIDGKKVDITKWLNENGISELKQVEKDGYRTKHYQTTRGGIGCFLSHLTVAQKLVDDTKNSIYLVLEDDAIIPEVTLKNIKYTLQTAPSENWDFILLGTHRIKGVSENEFIKVSAFWGLFGYLVNKKGAQKLINFVNEDKIDAQIDSYMAALSQQSKLNIYSTKDAIIYNNGDNTTDIQMPLIQMRGEDPYIYKNYRV